MEASRNVNIVTQSSLNPPFFISTLQYKDLLLSKRKSTSSLQPSPDTSSVLKTSLKTSPPQPRSYSKPISPDKPQFTLKTFSSTENSKFGLSLSKFSRSNFSFASQNSNKTSPIKSTLIGNHKISEKPKSLIQIKAIFNKIRSDLRDLRVFKREIDGLKSTIEQVLSVLGKKPLQLDLDKSLIIRNERSVIQQKIKIRQLEDTLKNTLLEKATMQSRLIDDNYKILLYTEQARSYQTNLKQLESEFTQKLKNASKEYSVKLKDFEKKNQKLDLILEKHKVDLNTLTQKLKTEQEKSKASKEELDFCSNENIKLMQNSINLIEEILELKKLNQELKGLGEKQGDMEKLNMENEQIRGKLKESEKRDQELMVLRKKWERNKEKKNSLIEKWENLELDLNRLLQEKGLWEKKEKMWRENEELWEKNEELWKIEKMEWESKEQQRQESQILWEKKAEDLAEGLRKVEIEGEEVKKQWEIEKSQMNIRELGLLNRLKEVNSELEGVKAKFNKWKSKNLQWKNKERQWEKVRMLWESNEKEWERERSNWEGKKKRIKLLKTEVDQVQELWKEEKDLWAEEKLKLEEQIRNLNERLRESLDKSDENKGILLMNEQNEELQAIKTDLERSKKLINNLEIKKTKWKHAKAEFKTEEKYWKTEKLELMYNQSELLSQIHQFEADHKVQTDQINTLKSHFEGQLTILHENFLNLSKILEKKFEIFSKALKNSVFLLHKLKNSSKIPENISPRSTIPLNLEQDLQESSVIPTDLFSNPEFLESNLQKLQSCLPQLIKLINLFTSLVETRSKPPKSNQIPAKLNYFSQVPTEYLIKILTSLKNLQKPTFNLVQSLTTSEISPISPNPALKIEISYQLSESEQKSEENYTKDLELVIFDLKEKHENDLIKIYSEMDERENLFNVEILRLNDEIVDLERDFRLKSEETVQKLRHAEENLREKNDEIEHLHAQVVFYMESIENLQQKLRTGLKVVQSNKFTETDSIVLFPADQYQILQTLYEESSQHLSALRINNFELAESYKTLKTEFETLQAENNVLMEENENLNDELKSFQFSNKL